MGKFKMNKAGFNELRQSAAVQQVITEKANGVRQRVDGLAHDSGGFEQETVTMPTRAVAYVRATTPKAIRACRDRNVLLKAVR